MNTFHEKPYKQWDLGVKANHWLQLSLCWRFEIKLSFKYKVRGESDSQECLLIYVNEVNLSSFIQID